MIDRCAGRRLAAWLTEQGHDVVHVADLGQDPGDERLLRHAASEHRVLVTIDSDFGTLIFRDSAPHCGLIRLPDVPAPVRIDVMRQLLERHADEIVAGAVVTVRGDRVRIAKPSRPSE